MKSRKISSHYLITGGRLYRNPLITVDGDGSIISVEHDISNTDSLANVEFYSGLLIPGMVNTHCHIEYSYMCGKIAQGRGLPHFISSIIEAKRDENISEEKKIAAANLQDAIMYKQGITAIGDHNNSNYTDQIKQRSRIYYHTFVELFNARGEDEDDLLGVGVRRIEELNKKGLRATISPHAVYSMSDKLISLCGQSGGGALSVHFKESVVMGGDNETERILNAVSEKRDSVILVHGIYACQQDIEKAKAKYGDKLSVALCPLSNLFIENKVADVEMLMQNGIRITLGTDSLSSNLKLDMVCEMRAISKLYPAIPLTEIVSWATINGAVALCIDSWAGSIERGKTPGIMNISCLDLENVALTDKSTAKRVL